MNRLIIVGSPRDNGRSASLAELLFEACIEECPEDELALVPVSTLDIAGCQGCDSCRALAQRRAEARRETPEAVESDGDERARCVIDDDMAEVYQLIDEADELIVVSPVYFAGAPAQLKALLDRLQPYFWSDARTRPKRSATLHVVGEGGDPHGFDPLAGVVRSALSCAGFKLERVLDWVGKIDDDGEITAEAEERERPPLPGAAPASSTPSDDDAPQSASQVNPEAQRERPVLCVSEAEKPAPNGVGSKQGSGAAGRNPRSSQSASKQKRSGQSGSKQNRSKKGGKRRG